jgi:hypothetical protein
MKTNVIIAEAVVGKSTELNITEMIVINNKITYLKSLLDKSKDKEFKSSSVWIDSKVVQEIVTLLSKMVDSSISLEQSEKDLFEVQVKAVSAE